MTLSHPRDKPLKTEEAEALADSLLELAWSLQGTEYAVFVSKIVNSARALCKNGEFPTNPKQLQYFRTALSVLGRVQRHRRMTPNGVLYRGRPAWVTDELLAALNKEAIEDVRPRAIWQRGHMLGVGGPLGDEIAKGPDLHALVNEVAGETDATGVASFLFYEVEGSGIPAHIDSDVFSINVNLILRREDTGVRQTSFYVFSVDGRSIEKMYLEPGDMVITYGDSVMHGRTLLAAGEIQTNYTVGFQPTHWEG